jgi:signal transduction histidine kinase
VATLTGISRIDGLSLRSYGRAEGLASNLITGISADEAGTVWVSSHDAGLYRLVGDRFMRVAERELPDELDSMVSDGHGSLWLQGRAGIFQITARDLAHCSSSTECHASKFLYGVEDGVPSLELVARGYPSSVRLDDGTVWFATRRGVAIVDPRAMQRNAVPPPVVVERFTVDDRDWPISSSLQQIGSGHRRYSFEFKALSFPAPSKVRYRVKLDGFDPVWSEPSDRSSATYTNLPPGEYVFRVQAANNDGVWNEAGVSLQLRIAPPFYRRWWFIALASLGCAGIVFLLYRLRLRRLQQSFEAVLAERNRIAREVHDTLAQDFVGVSLQLDLVQRMLAREQLDAARAQIIATREIVKPGLDEARRSIWNLRSNTAADSLPARIDALAKRFTRAGFGVGKKIGGAYRPLPGTIEQEVLRIVREALSNVDHHAGASVATVELRYQERALEVCVRDNGLGFDPEQSTARRGHYGLQGMQERASNIGATIDIVSAAGEGTSVCVIVPTRDAAKRTEQDGRN